MDQPAVPRARTKLTQLRERVEQLTAQIQAIDLPPEVRESLLEHPRAWRKRLLIAETEPWEPTVNTGRD
jgi:hypothetical protein